MIWTVWFYLEIEIASFVAIYGDYTIRNVSHVDIQVTLTGSTIQSFQASIKINRLGLTKLDDLLTNAEALDGPETATIDPLDGYR